MPRVLFLVAFLLSVLAVEAGAQSVIVPLSESAYVKTLDAMRIWRFCNNSDLAIFQGLDLPTDSARVSIVASQGCTDPAVQRVVDFVERRQNPPTRGELDDALELLHEALESASLLDSSTSVGALSGGSAFLSLPTAALVVTDFLMDRAKAELIQSAFADLAKAFDSGDLAILLPSTGRVLARAEMIDYRSLLPTFRAALREDLRSLPVHAMDPRLSFYRVCETPDTLYSLPAGVCEGGTVRQLVPDGVRLAGTTAEILLRLDGGDDVLLLLSEMSSVRGSAWQDPAVGQVVRTAARMALELRAYQAFAGPTAPRVQEGFPNLLRAPQEGAVFLAFLQDDLKFTTKRSHIEELARALGDVVNAVTSTSGFSGAPADPAAVRARTATAVVSALQVALLMLTDETRARELRRDLGTALALWRAAEDRDYPRIVILVADRIVLDMNREDVEASAMPIRILSFASAMAAAESSEDIRAALNTLADPVGSFRSRRLTNAWKVSVVSYVGAGAGRESLDLPGGEGVGYAGAFAPVGLELSRGMGGDFISSVGLYANLVDLGTLVSYRLDDSQVVSGPEGEDTVDKEPDVNLKHVFSPGVHLVLGITRNRPISLGLGWQRAPELRTLEASDARVTANRIVIFLGVDLTLLRF